MLTVEQSILRMTGVEVLCYLHDEIINNEQWHRVEMRSTFFLSSGKVSDVNAATETCFRRKLATSTLDQFTFML